MAVGVIQPMKQKFTSLTTLTNMNLNSIESKIVTAYALKDQKTLSDTYIELATEKNKLDRWFNKYIDMFDEKLSTCDKNDPIRKLYNNKFDHYTKLSRCLRIAESYMKKEAHV